MSAALTELIARALIDDALKAKLREMKGKGTWTEVAAHINRRGFTVSAHNIAGIIKSATSLRTVPYLLYIEIVGKEPERIFWKESPDLARRIAFWHCYFSDTGNYELAGRVAAELQKGGLKYTVKGVYQLLFAADKKSINPLITDALARLFMFADGKAQFSSLDEVKDLVAYFDRNNTNGRRYPGKRMWPEVEPVVDALQRITGASFRNLLGRKPRDYYANGHAFVTVERLAQLQKRLQDLPQYRLIQLLGYAVKVLQTSELPDAKTELVSLLAELSDAERRLLVRGSHNYGTAAFANHVLPHYFAIKRQHAFPVKQLEFLVDFPAANVRNRKADENGDAAEAFAASVGKRLRWYKQHVLDHNIEIGFKFGVTRDGLEAMLKEAVNNARTYSQTELRVLDV